MKISLELARKILEAFGPCTTTYETTTSKELAESSAEFDGTFSEFLSMLLRVETVYLDRMIDGAYYQEQGGAPQWVGAHQGAIVEANKMVSEIKKRLSKLETELV